MNDWVAVRAQAIITLSRCDPGGYEARYNQLLRGGLSANSIPEGSRSAEAPLPGFDNTDVVLQHDRKAYDEAWKQLAVVVGKLAHFENALLLVLGIDVRDPDPKRQAAARRETVRKAREILKDESAGGYFFTCINCGQEFQRTAEIRPRAGRCPACAQYYYASGMLRDAPVDVTERRKR